MELFSKHNLFCFISIASEKKKGKERKEIHISVPSWKQRAKRFRSEHLAESHSNAICLETAFTTFQAFFQALSIFSFS